MDLKAYAVKDIMNLKVLGRTTKSREPLTLFWTGSGIECNVKASELWVEVEADYDCYEPWISVVINGAYITRRMVERGKQWICLFRNMNPQVIKNVKLLKEVQAMSGDEKHCLQISRFKTDGSFEPVAAYPYKLEFIGDSITSGEGAIGALKEEDWISMWFSTENNYAVMTANALNADYHIISQSGWGVLTSWDNNPYGALPLYYEKVCGLLKGKQNELIGAQREYDFASWQPDAVIINLGTNDSGAFNSAKWEDEKTGESHKQRMNEDGSYNEEDLNAFKEAVISFLEKLRKYNPNARLIWVYGMLGNPLETAILEAIQRYKEKTDDKKVEFLGLPDTTKETVGARQHPGVKAHRAASEVIIKRLKELLI
nr:SGNH/GDSL hydrolase family protein [uncultured Cellulosilyticum sp.]